MHKDIGRYVDYSANAVPAANFAAGTSMLATTAGAMSSVIIDRLALPRLYRSCILVIGAELTAPTAFTANITAKLQDAASSTVGAFADYTSGVQLTTGLTLGSTSSTGFDTYDSGIQPAGTSSATGLRGQLLVPIDLGAARRFIQAVVVPSMGSSSSGVLSVGGVLVFGGAEELASTS